MVGDADRHGFSTIGELPNLPLSEDCLVLNVWTPGLEGKRPVMVWLHGRGYAAGGGSEGWYNGANLAKRGDTVVITINHRLNVFGYLHLADINPAFAGSGVAGMLDCVQALLERLGLPRQRFHDLRHAAATFMLAQGVDLRVVMEVLGHSQIAVTANTYAHVRIDATRVAVERVDALLSR